MKKYSVLMSLYYKENAEYLALALDSMINQTIKPDEIVMIYDGPLTDNLYQVMDSYVERYPNLFNIIKNEKNIGLGSSLRKGVERCKNELIARMDTDDISVNNRCEQQLELFNADEDLDIVGGNINEFIDSPKKIVSHRNVPSSDQNIKKYMKGRCAFNHMTVMFKKSSVLQSGNYIDWHFNEDYYLWLRMMKNKCKFANIDSALCYVRVGKEMYSRRGGIKYFKSERQLQNYMLENKIINQKEYLINVLKRFIVQVLLPNRIRGIVFKLFARD